MIAQQITEILYWALGITGMALCLGLIIFLARWYATGHVPTNSSTPASPQKSHTNAGTALAWFQVFKD